MKLKLPLVLIAFFLSFNCLAQIGIGTTSPNAVLDIKSSNQATPSNTDGLLIPKIDAFPAINPTASQQGMLVYLTTTSGLNQPGFYYWDNISSTWIGMNSTMNSDADWYKVGTTSAPTTITDQMFHTGNVAIGKNTTSYPFEVLSTAYDRGINNIFSNGNNNGADKAALFNTHSGSSNDPVYGVSNTVNNSGNGSHFGTGNSLNGTGTGTHYGTYNTITGTGAGIQIGTRNTISNTGNNTHYGISSSLSGTGSGDHYGSLTDLNGTGTGEQHGSDNLISNSGNNTHYGTNNVLSGTGSGTHYGYNATLSGAGTGRQYGHYNNITNSGDNIHYGNYNDLSGSGIGNHFGTVNNLSGTGTGILYGVYNSIGNTGSGNHFGGYTDLTGTGTGQQIGYNTTISNTGGGIHYGYYSDLNGAGAGDQYGQSNAISNTGAGIHYGVSNLLSGAGTGQQYGVSNTISNSGNATHYGNFNSLTGIGTGNKYGSYNFIDSAAGGTHYGVYSEALKSGNNYAGYFLGKVSIGTTTANNYIMPSSRGTNGQIMQTDGLGNVTWQSLNSSSWLTTGNSGTVPATNFIGTTDDQDIVFKRNNIRAGFLGNPNTTSGNMNTSFGANSLVNPSGTGTRNVAIGTNVLPSNTTGNRNVSIGDQSMFSNVSGTENTAMGVGALYSSTQGVCNVAIGRNALTSTNGLSGTQGSNNTGVGYVALRSNTIGAYNNALGRDALYSNTTGNNNVGIGYQAGYSNLTGNSNVFIGNQAGYNEAGSNRLYIENTNADANNSLIYGEFDNNILRANGQVQIGNPAVTGYALPTTRGNNGQVLQTNGAGATSWVDNPASTFSVMRANLGSGLALATSGWQLINFSTTAFDANSEFNSGSSRFVAAKTGYYQVNAGYFTDAQANTQYYSIGVRKNGSFYQENGGNHTANGPVSRTINCLVYLTAGDYIEIYAENYQSGVTIDSYSGKTFFEVHQVR